MNPYDNPEFFAEYAKMSRSQYGLEGAGEWRQLEPMFPEMSGKAVLDLGCGYGWHCKYAAERGAASVLGIDQSARMDKRFVNDLFCVIIGQKDGDSHESV